MINNPRSALHMSVGYDSKYTDVVWIPNQKYNKTSLVMTTAANTEADVTHPVGILLKHQNTHKVLVKMSTQVNIKNYTME